MYYLLSTYHGKTAKLQKAKTTPFLHFPGKGVPNLVLNKKDPLRRISRKTAISLVSIKKADRKGARPGDEKYTCVAVTGSQ